MSIQEDYDFLFKTVIVGDTHVGKTQILSRFIENNFMKASKPTIGVEIGTKTTTVGGVIVKNQIWDTAGQQKFRALTCSYYRGAVGAIIVFDLTKAITFEHVQRWIKEVREYSEPDVSILLVGNKVDLDCVEVRQQEIENFACSNKLLYLSTSAATGQNIQLAFQTLVKGKYFDNEEILGHSKPNENYLSDTEDDPSSFENNLGVSVQGKDEKKSGPQSEQGKNKLKILKREGGRMEAFQVQNGSNGIKITRGQKVEGKKKSCC